MNTAHWPIDGRLLADRQISFLHNTIRIYILTRRTMTLTMHPSPPASSSSFGTGLKPTATSRGLFLFNGWTVVSTRRGEGAGSVHLSRRASQAARCFSLERRSMTAQSSIVSSLVQLMTRPKSRRVAAARTASRADAAGKTTSLSPPSRAVNTILNMTSPSSATCPRDRQMCWQ